MDEGLLVFLLLLLFVLVIVSWILLFCLRKKGDTGAQGLRGPQGILGTAGAQGPLGAQGILGAQGPLGAQGINGAQGIVGAQGAAGPAVRTTRINFGTGNVAEPAPLTTMKMGCDEVFANPASGISSPLIFSVPFNGTLSNPHFAATVFHGVGSTATIQIESHIIVNNNNNVHYLNNGTSRAGSVTATNWSLPGDFVFPVPTTDLTQYASKNDVPSVPSLSVSAGDIVYVDVTGFVVAGTGITNWTANASFDYAY